jgi:hypothetical protein
MEAHSNRQTQAFSPLEELDEMRKKMRASQGAYVPPGQQEDIDLINKAYTAVPTATQRPGPGRQFHPARQRVND